MPRLKILFAATLALTAIPAAAQTADRYDMSPAEYRAAAEQALYPAGVANPVLGNPPPVDAVPLAPPPVEPPHSVPLVAQAIGNSASVPCDAGEPICRLYPPSRSDGPPYPPYPAPAPASAGGPPFVQYGQTAQVYPTGQIPAPPTVEPTIIPAANTSQLPASWYTRIDYYHWNERIAGADFVNESGSLFTLGYERRVGSERFRAEFFGGDVHYDGYGVFDSTNAIETLPSNTGYLGLRGEYEMIFEPAAWHGNAALLAGLGTRFWIRDLHDGETDNGTPVYGYQETWWTTYPYLGLESHSSRGKELDFYTDTSAGMTALTYEFASIGDRPLWPRPGVMANTEIGLRGERFYVAVRGEAMSWEASSVVQDAYQPHSIMYTIGGRLGVMF